MTIKEAIHWRNASDESFCGRSDLITMINYGLDKYNSFAVIGQQGMGKSMLLNRLLHTRACEKVGDPIPILYKFSGNEKDMFEIVLIIKDRLAAKLAMVSGKSETKLNKALKDEISAFRNTPILRMIKKAESMIEMPVSVELFFDDMHRIRKHIWVEDFIANIECEMFGDYTHALLLRGVFSGDVRMKKLLEDLPFSDLWQKLREIWLQPLKKDEIEELIQRIEFPNEFAEDRSLVSLIYEWSGGHPNILQYLIRDILECENLKLSLILENSALRFIAELGKILEKTWNNIDEKAQELIKMIIETPDSITVSSLPEKLSIRYYLCLKALKCALAGGFVRVDNETILPPAKVISLWINSAIEAKSENEEFSSRICFDSSSDLSFSTILHLSDLHFAKGGHAWSDQAEIHGVGRPEHDRLRLIDSLMTDLESLRDRNECFWPSVVLISGDLIYKSQCEGENEAVTFLKELSYKLGIENTKIVMCPGNHEINYKIQVEEPRAQFSSYTRIWNKYYEPSFRRLPLEWFPGEYVHLYSIDNMEILSLNSCEDLKLEPDKNTVSATEQGYISNKQLEVAENLLGTKEPPKGYIRIAVLHHHLFQYQWSLDTDYSILREVERVITWLRLFNFDIVFHGHQHCAGTHTRLVDDRFLTIISGGSAGVVSKHRWRGGMPLTYQIVSSFSKNHAVRICRRFDLLSASWEEFPFFKPVRFPLGRVMFK